MVKVYCKCDFCGRVGYHEVADRLIVLKDGIAWTVTIARCSSCGKEFEATWER